MIRLLTASLLLVLLLGAPGISVTKVYSIGLAASILLGLVGARSFGRH